MLRDLFSLFPACAGVIPERVANKAGSETFPRMCGGDPEGILMSLFVNNFSPHVRG